MCQQIRYFADIPNPVFPEVINVITCTKKLRKKPKKATMYIVLYAFEDSKSLIVLRIPKHSLFLF